MIFCLGASDFVQPHQTSPQPEAQANVPPVPQAPVKTPKEKLDEIEVELKNLQNLDFTQNQISKLNGDDFNGLSNLKRLNLSYNQISDLNGQEFNGHWIYTGWSSLK